MTATLALLSVSTLPGTEECPRRRLLSGLSGKTRPTAPPRRPVPRAVRRQWQHRHRGRDPRWSG